MPTTNSQRKQQDRNKKGRADIQPTLPNTGGEKALGDVAKMCVLTLAHNQDYFVCEKPEREPLGRMGSFPGFWQGCSTCDDCETPRTRAGFNRRATDQTGGSPNIADLARKQKPR